MRTHRISGSLLLAAVLVLSGLATAQTFNAASDFSASSNPNGAWSYGWTTSRGSQPFNLFVSSGQINRTYDGGNLVTWLDTWTTYGIPLVFHNASTAYVVTGGNYPQGCCAPVPIAGLGFHPGPNGENAVVRWTASAAGVYRVNATFPGVDYGGHSGTTTDVAVLHNGVQLWAGNVVAFGSHYEQFYSGTVSVLAGDTIDFTLGYGMVASGNDFVLYPYANYYSDSTGLDAVITPVSQQLSADVANLIAGSNLTATQKSVLNNLLSAISSAMASGNKSTAISDLKLLVGDVTLLMWSTPPRVPAVLGDQLISDANETIAMLSS